MSRKCNYMNCNLKYNIVIGKCTFCNNCFCNNHRLQEMHTCVFLTNYIKKKRDELNIKLLNDSIKDIKLYKI